MKERYDDNEIRYYHGGLGAAENKRDFDRNTSDGDFGREYENRYRNHEHPQDYRNRRDYDAHRFDDYARHTNGYEANYRQNRYQPQPRLENTRHGYGIHGFEGRMNDQYQRVRNMERERMAKQQQQQQQASGSHRGYSGARFGGSNYSANGDFGGAPEYGAMSGAGGNAENYTSYSGYGGGYSGQPSQGQNQTHYPESYNSHGLTGKWQYNPGDRYRFDRRDDRFE